MLKNILQTIAMPRHLADNGKRVTRGKTLPTMIVNKTRVGKTSSSHSKELGERRSLIRPRKVKRKTENFIDTKSDSSAVTKDTNEQTTVWPKAEERRSHNVSGLKIEAFDFFHEMLSQCCGSHKLNVFEAASILKQFTPDVVKTVIYVIAENAKRTSQLQNDEENVQDFSDPEISRITSKQQKSKWQQMPELVQPRLTSPVSNSCSPVSAAVQALMSFARPDAEEQDKQLAMEKENEKIDKEATEKTNLNVFYSDTMNASSSSPFLQPMSSMMMLHTEPEKLQITNDMLSSESDQDRPTFVSALRDSVTSSSSSMSPHFPWIQSPQNKVQTDKEKIPKNNEKFLPSISSILGPMNTPFTELPFSLQTSVPSFGIAKAASKVTAIQTHFPQSPLSLDTSSTVVTMQNISESLPSPGNLLFTSSNLNTKQQKTVFRTILPKPVEKSTSTKQVYVPEEIMKTENKIKKNDEKLNLLSLDTKTEPLRKQNFAQNSTNKEKIITVVHPNSCDALSSLPPRPLFMSPLNQQDNTDKEQTILQKPLFNVINARERGLNTKNSASNRVSSASASKGKKSNTSGNNSGNLEVASALLSMGSAESKGKESAKVVSSFNREKATFDIEESSSAQRGNILFTATGTFQIEDIEIDPKKNKIEKDSYECGKCGRVFTSLVYLARHIKRVCPDMSLRKWKCDRCEKAFRHPFGLQQHIYTHTGERPYKCDQCAKAFYSANDLRRHKRTHSGERPYSCSHCKKAFSTTISLKTHTYIHTGEKPHKCPHCPKTFATSSKLSRHVVTHSDKRPFSCDICVKTFNRSGDLRRHYNNVHHLEHGLLSCNQCNKLFATQICLQNHKTTHNRDETSKSDLETISEPGVATSISELMSHS